MQLTRGRRLLYFEKCKNSTKFMIMNSNFGVLLCFMSIHIFMGLRFKVD